MDTISGLPAHPLVVHLPVVLLPLTAFGVVLTLIRRSWYYRYRWAVLFTGALGTLGAILAASSGEGLEHLLSEKEGAEFAKEIHDHAEAGEMARTVAIVFFVALFAYVVAPWFLARRGGGDEKNAALKPAWLRPALSIAVVVTALASMFTVWNAGHSGAKSAWAEDVAAESDD